MNGNHHGYVQFYQGAPLPQAEVALIKGHNSYRNGSAANDMVRIVAIDDKPVPGEFGVAEGADMVALKPGLHRVKVLFVSGYSEVDLYTYGTLQIEAKPGCRYDLTTQLMMPTKMIDIGVVSAPLGMSSPSDCKIDDDPPSKADNERA